MKRSLPRSFSMPSKSIARFTPAARSVVLTKATCEMEGAASNACSKEGANIAAPKVVEASLRNCLRFIVVPLDSLHLLDTHRRPEGKGRNAECAVPGEQKHRLIIRTETRGKSRSKHV